jgi:hypothetical protein
MTLNGQDESVLNRDTDLSRWLWRWHRFSCGLRHDLTGHRFVPRRRNDLRYRCRPRCRCCSCCRCRHKWCGWLWLWLSDAAQRRVRRSVGYSGPAHFPLRVDKWVAVEPTARDSVAEKRRLPKFSPTLPGAKLQVCPCKTVLAEPAPVCSCLDTAPRSEVWKRSGNGPSGL